MNHIWEWLAVLVGLLLLAYTMIVIKEEKASFKENAVTFGLKNFSFDVPSWWTAVEELNEKLVFKRTDTRYDWLATLEWFPEYDSSKGIKEQLAERIILEEIIFDGDVAIVQNPEQFKLHPDVQNNKIEILRVEGTATQKEINRIYYDAYLIRDLDKETYLYCSSRSSILNGMLEGPYFEEAMGNIKRI